MHKRQILGISSQPQNALRVKNTRTEQPKVDNNESLEQKLKNSGEPAIGLEYIEEHINPQNINNLRLYTCSLASCKSAWGQAVLFISM